MAFIDYPGETSHIMKIRYSRMARDLSQMRLQWVVDNLAYVCDTERTGDYSYTSTLRIKPSLAHRDMKCVVEYKLYSSEFATATWLPLNGHGLLLHFIGVKTAYSKTRMHASISQSAHGSAISAPKIRPPSAQTKNSDTKSSYAFGFPYRDLFFDLLLSEQNSTQHIGCEMRHACVHTIG